MTQSGLHCGGFEELPDKNKTKSKKKEEEEEEENKKEGGKLNLNCTLQLYPFI